MSVGLSSPHGDWTFLNERRQEVAVSVELASMTKYCISQIRGRRGFRVTWKKIRNVSEDLLPYHAELAVASGKPTSGLPVNRPQS